MGEDDTRAYAEKRSQPRHAVRLEVNYRCGDTYLFSRSSNLSEMGIFLTTPTPLSKGTQLELDFADPGFDEPIRVLGEVMWTLGAGPGVEPGMGVRFIDPSPETRARVKALIRTMAYLE
jgi:type IV pilus assembly protein PilZ